MGKGVPRANDFLFSVDMRGLRRLTGFYSVIAPDLAPTSGQHFACVLQRREALFASLDILNGIEFTAFAFAEVRVLVASIAGVIVFLVLDFVIRG